jgi:drug/metabolite transporter (DMT)-like permease
MIDLRSLWKRYKMLINSILFSTWLVYKCTAITLWDPTWFMKLSEWTPPDRFLLLFIYFIIFSFCYSISKNRKES